MKSVKSRLIVLCFFLFLTGFTPYVSSDENDDVSSFISEHEFSEKVIINGEIRDVRVVTQEEYEKDTSGDFLVILDYSEVESVQSRITRVYKNDSITLEFSSQKFVKEILVFVGSHVAGKILDKGFVYLVNSPVAQAIALKAAAAVATAIPYVALFVIGASYVYTIYYLATDSASLKRISNASGCVFSGVYPNGQWLCPYSLPIEEV